MGATITDVIPPQLSRQVNDVQFQGNFQSVTYDASTGTAVFQLFNPLPAGTTAQVSISALFPPGTAVGTQAVNQGSMSASNAPSVTSNQVIVTAKAQSDWTVTKNVVPAGTPPQVDTPYTYRVGLTLAAGGTQNLNGVVFTDTLPAGAQFVSATGGGTFDAGTNTVTWPPRDLVPQPNSDVSSFEQVTVIFPAANFPVGTNILNVVVANGTPAGEPTQELGRAERPGIIRGAGTVTAGSKRNTLPDLGPGQNDTYTLVAENPNTSAVGGFQVLETLPPQLVMVQDGSPNITGTGPQPVAITATPGGNVPISGGATWTATAPAAAGTLLFDYGTAPPGLPLDGPDQGRDPGQRHRSQRSAHRARFRRSSTASPSAGRARQSTPAAARPRTSSRSASSSPSSSRRPGSRSQAPSPTGPSTSPSPRRRRETWSTLRSSTACRPGSTWWTRPTRPTL